MPQVVEPFTSLKEPSGQAAQPSEAGPRALPVLGCTRPGGHNSQLMEPMSPWCIVLERERETGGLKE